MYESLEIEGWKFKLKFDKFGFLSIARDIHF
jgi:hypothetical protein